MEQRPIKCVVGDSLERQAAESPMGIRDGMTGETVSCCTPEDRWFESTLPTIGNSLFYCVL